MTISDWVGLDPMANYDFSENNRYVFRLETNDYRHINDRFRHSSQSLRQLAARW